MDELLQRVAEIKGMPASLIKRSAEARADKTGTTIEAVLQEWAGEEAADSAVEEAESAVAESAPSAVSSQPSAEEDPEADEAPQEITTDYLVQLAADAKRMPPKLILSSATARADHARTSLEAVLVEWAGVDIEELKQQAASAQTKDKGQKTKDTPAAPEAEVPDAAEEQQAVPAVAAAAAGAMTMDELLEKVAEVKGMPASLAKRSAEARSKKTGEPVEAVLAEWAGVEADSIAPESAPSAISHQPSAEQEAEVGEPAADEPESAIEVIEGSTPDVEEPDEEEDGPVARGGYPKWLAAAFVLIPLLAVVYILVTPNGPDCGTAGQLLIDPTTGESVNCDGSNYGDTTVDYFAQGESLYGQCVACHGSDGSGGAGPAFAGGAVLATFPADSCDQHIEWIRVGTAGWPDPTYGANETPVGGFGLMPSFVSMTDEQRASVALYERVQFGGQPLEEAEVDCELVEASVVDGESTEAAGS